MVIYHNEAMATTPMTGDGLYMFIPPIKVVILGMVYDSVYHVRVLRMVILGMGFIIDKMVMLTSPFFDLETFLIPSPVQKKNTTRPKDVLHPLHPPCFGAICTREMISFGD